VHLAWERVPDRAGEGSLTQIQLPELAETKGPHPAFGHLLPFFEREKAIFVNIRNEVRRRVMLH
jgi:hypothetical protein